MPKPGKLNNQTAKSWKNQYNEPDVRVNEGQRRVSFKPTKHRRDPKDMSALIRLHLGNEDVYMGDMGPSQRRMPFNKKWTNRSGSPAPGRGGRKLFESLTSWYRVTLPHGNKYEKTFVVNMLVEKLSPLPFAPVMWSVNGTVVTFYIDEYKIAEKLFNLDRQIQCPDGFKLIIKVNPGSPHVEIGSEMKEKMKLVMAKRYNAATKALDLTKFHADPELQDYFCWLGKPVIFVAVIEIIAENIPELEALNLFDNKIQILINIKKLSEKLPNLKILHLGKNKLKEMTMFDAFIGLPIVDLVLDGNPVCDKFKDKDTYISEVRKKFPKVVKLDGLDLPPPIIFDVQEETHMPPSQQTFLCNQAGQDVVRKFLEQYFLIYDTDDRQQLLAAYHEQAMFSMTMSYPYGQGQKSTAWLNWYQTDNRNLLKVQDKERRYKLLKQGHVEVVAFLKDMPATKHDLHSFLVDLVIFLPQMLVMTVTGMFKELKSGHKVPPIRHFFRTMVIVPAGSGYCIANEVLHISNATDAQSRNAFKNPEPIAAPPPTPSASGVAPPVVPAVGPDDATKQQMVQAMSQLSGMNLDWSQKCLAEMQWDYQRASVVFAELHKEGKIPAEAFVK